MGAGGDRTGLLSRRQNPNYDPQPRIAATAESNLYLARSGHHRGVFQGEGGRAVLARAAHRRLVCPQPNAQAPRYSDPIINAAIKGTEFLIKAGPQGGQVTVFEGEVETSNAEGRVVLKDGQTAVAARDEAPRLALEIRPEDGVQWALYFPPLVDYAALQARVRDPDIAEGIRRYADGDVAGALAALDRVPEASRDADFAALYAGLLLSVGRVDEAEPLLAMYMGEKTPAPIDALRSVIALARNQKSEALRLANAAVQTDPA